MPAHRVSGFSARLVVHTIALPIITCLSNDDATIKLNVALGDLSGWKHGSVNTIDTDVLLYFPTLSVSRRACGSGPAQLHAHLRSRDLGDVQIDLSRKYTANRRSTERMVMDIDGIGTN